MNLNPQRTISANQAEDNPQGIKILEELQQFANSCTKPWLIAGDFNETISLEERNHDGPDHVPLLISSTTTMEPTKRNKPFRFQAAWMTHRDLDGLVQEHWIPRYPLMPNLNTLASELSKWNKDSFDNLFQRKRRLWDRLKGIQRCLTAGGPRHFQKLEEKLRKELDTTLDQIDTFWF
ncbi:hypothetical protein Cgig2_010781 [Carnegiea gigantea]|uniref:Endonuclease/exonuclease/phosphatase domain-containing protein n=1 Tax=Carnegiea gigantea TaxID=171969 RepID=A0A9Q1GH94_9CARY|nr:hypothetical protein Cgig2_010781 [Carnegiea gigantea]